MQLTGITKEQVHDLCTNLDKHIEETKDIKVVKYLDLGVKIVRLICYSQEVLTTVERQMTFVLKDSADHYDVTLVAWKVSDIKTLPQQIDDKLFNPRTNLKLRVEMLASKTNVINVRFMKDENIKNSDMFVIRQGSGEVLAYDEITNTYYYGVEDLNPEVFAKRGHIFVQTISRILKDENSSLVHGAVVGLEGNGILFCAAGRRGKSTLTVLSLLEGGFEYVSDDYLTLEKDGENLYSYPIYSIIKLSHRMYNEMYDELDGTRFIANNEAMDKYTINIANMHDRFMVKYPIKLCMFPKIVSDEKPSIVPCDKEIGIEQLITSTTIQMHDDEDEIVLKRLRSFIEHYDFYQINLCNDIHENVKCLKSFMEEINKKKGKNNELCIK